MCARWARRVGAGSCAKIWRPRSFFPSGERSYHSWISARVRSAQPSTMVSRLTKKSTARAPEVDLVLEHGPAVQELLVPPRMALLG